MDDGAVLSFVLVSLIGWVLGVVGFFRAGRALRQLRVLNETFAYRAPVAEPVVRYTAPAAPVPEPASPEPVAAEPEAVVPVVPEIQSAPQPVPPAFPPPWSTHKIDIEALLTMRWGVWLGAAALLFAGIFLIRYASDQGLLGPLTRCVAATLLGLALVAGGEWLRRREQPIERLPAAMQDQVPAALAAGGVATLFGAAYGFGPYYDLVPVTVGFGLMGAAGFAGMALSLFQGQLVAVIGIAGAFLTPALVDAQAPNLPGLFAYLLVVTAAALGVVRYSAWVWLGWFATIAAAFWVLIITGTVTAADVWAPGLFVPAVALINLALLPPAALETGIGRKLAWIPFAILGLAGLALCLQIDDFMAKAGVLLLGPVAVWAGWQRPVLDRLPWLAALFLFAVLLIWALPDWHPTGEAIMTGGRVQAFLPGDWAPQEIRPLLSTAAVMALFFALAGLWLERHAARPLSWAALPAAVPVLTLAITYAQVRLFQADPEWAIGAVILMGALVGTAALAKREGDIQRAGAHGAGAVASLALGCGMILADHWLTLAIALLLPALAWIEAASDLPPLRKVALAVAAFVLIRLFANWYLFDYVFGSFPVVNGLLAAYGVPALAFAFAARRFRRRADDLLVAVLQAGAAALVTALVAAEIHHWANGGVLNTAATSFLENALHIAALGLVALATLWVNRRTNAPVLRWAWMIQGGLAFGGAVLLLLGNPAFTNHAVGQQPVANVLLIAYAVPAILALLARRLPEVANAKLKTALGTYALAAGFAWVTLEVRHMFHRHTMGLDQADIRPAELWAYSGAWLVCGVALLTLGILRESRTLRLAALGFVALTAGKVFLVDMAGLDGLWRVVSFLGLGLTLIGLGSAYRRFVTLPTPALQGGES